ncbi:MAG: HAMP domain-containing histidine kinase [Myxococcales bacterium]|nr:HAMP domain-containing histidine kinase [Myxococcales bacterium]
MSATMVDSSLRWVVRLRWISLGGLGVCAGFAKSEGQALRWWLIAVIIGLGVASNLALGWLPRRRGITLSRQHTSYMIAAALVLDMLLRTACLAVTGGASNPFSVLYLVHIALAAVVLTSRQTLAMAAVSVVLFALLFLVDVGQVHVHDPKASLFENKHLQGMWLAFTLAALITGYFVSRIAATLQAQREQIAELRETAARNARLASLTTLAAGAAHELSTPLGTIAVAAYEMRDLAKRQRSGATPDVSQDTADLDLILAEVERCQQIIAQLAPRSREGEEAVAISAADLERNLRSRLGGEWARIAWRAEPIALHAPAALVHTTVAAIVKNALDASPETGQVEVTIAPAAAGSAGTTIAVRDRGEGMTPAFLQRLGEPFFTTKEPGKGMGLGLFLAKSTMETLGGHLAIHSTPGQGTEVVLTFA